MEEGKGIVRVRNILDLAGVREVCEFFSFLGEIEQAGIIFDGVATGRMTYVTFKDPRPSRMCY